MYVELLDLNRMGLEETGTRLRQGATAGKWRVRVVAKLHYL